MKNEVYFYFIYHFIIFNSTPYMQYTGENELIPDEICVYFVLLTITTLNVNESIYI